MPDLPLILVVDDLEEDTFLIRTSLEKANVDCTFQAVRSGEEAISYLKGEGKYRDRQEFPLPDLILLDLKMIGMDGFEVLEWIRQHPTLRTLRVVVLTSSDQMQDVNRAYEFGANSFLVKPLDFKNYVQLGQFLNGYWLKLDRGPETSREARPENGKKGGAS